MIHNTRNIPSHLKLCLRFSKRTLPRLGGKAFLQEQWNDIRRPDAVDKLIADGALEAFKHVRTSAVLAGDEGFHEAGMAKR